MKSVQPALCKTRCDPLISRLVDQPIRWSAARTRVALDEGQFIRGPRTHRESPECLLRARDDRPELGTRELLPWPQPLREWSRKPTLLKVQRLRRSSDHRSHVRYLR